MLHPDDDIISRLRQDDLKTLQHLFDVHYKELVRYSMRFVMSKETAEEIVQDVFIRIWNMRDTLVIGKSVDAYLFASVKNGSINYLMPGRMSFSFADCGPHWILYATAARPTA